MAHQVAASLRSSERGLKFVRSTDADAVLTSLRSSERGLKWRKPHRYSREDDRRSVRRSVD